MEEKDVKARIEEVSDPNKVALYCEKHFYFGPPKSGDTTVKPHKGCPRCWYVYFFHDLMHTPPSLRAERLDLMTETIHHMVEHLEHGRSWDIDREAKIEYEG